MMDTKRREVECDLFGMRSKGSFQQTMLIFVQYRTFAAYTTMSHNPPTRYIVTFISRMQYTIFGN